ncbi:MAG: hypothetical protein KatS3mg081_1050 [Gemmatimonadales bacterium]|nr:MAG: hypothetical protein KatS3mg081_1050 [Gemmatimonadales bacterium]
MKRTLLILLAAAVGALSALGAYGMPQMWEKTRACPDKRCNGNECAEFSFGQQCYLVPPECHTVDCEF